MFHFTVTIARESITRYCGRLLLSLEMWRRYHPILWSFTAILGNVEKISPNIVADYCYPWKCGEDITQYCGRLLLSLEMWRRYHPILWTITAILGKWSIPGLQTRIIGERRFIECVRQLMGGVQHIFDFKTR